MSYANLSERFNPHPRRYNRLPWYFLQYVSTEAHMRWISFAIFVAVTLSAYGQNIEWTKTYGGDAFDETLSVIACSSGGYLGVGSTESLKSGPNVASSGYLVRTDAKGQVQWEKAIGTALSTYIHNAFEVADGYLLFGRSELKANVPDLGLYVAKVDLGGTLLWEKRYYVGDVDNIPGEVIRTGDGYYLATTYTPTEINMFKLTDSGSIVWQKSYAGTACYGLSQTANGDYIVAGVWKTPGFGNDILLLRVSPGGDSLWSKVYGSSDDEQALHVEEWRHGFLVIASASSGGNPGGIVAFSWSPIVVENFQMLIPSPRIISRVKATANGDFIVSGSTAPSHGDAFILRFTIGTDTLWSKQVKVDAEQVANDFQIVDDGYIVAGKTIGAGGSPTTNALLFKVGSETLSVPPGDWWLHPVNLW